MNFLYIEVENMNFNPTDNSILLNARWTGVPPNADGLPVYINFQPNPYQIRNTNTSFSTTQVTSQVESFFDKFTYTLNVDASTGDLTLLAHSR
jgi:hypothetical protein